MLEDRLWQTPSDYFGYQPEGEYVIAVKHRDSDLLTESNYDVFREQLAPHTYEWEATHWAVGWVRYLMLKPDAPQDVLEKAQELLDALQEYSVLDESDFTEREETRAQELWEDCSLEDRLWLIKDTELSQFCIRRSDFPRDDSGTVQDRLLS